MTDLASRREEPGFIFGYADQLARMGENRPKGARTSLRIRIAACSLLQSHAPQDLTVPALCKAAGIAHGTFYLHFPDRNVLVADTLLGFVAFLQETMRRASAHQPGDPIRASTKAYAEMFEANAGLMKCLLHHHEAFPEAREAFHKLNSEWIETVVASVERRLRRGASADAVPREELLRRAYALGGMVDQYLSGLFLSADPALIAVSAERKDVINTLCLIWERGMET